MILIHNVTLLTPRHRVEDGAVLIQDGRVLACGPAETVLAPADVQRMDGGGHFLAPGFLDLQVNGGFGLDFTADPSTIWAVGEQLPRYGVTAFLPTIITAPLAVSRAAQDVLRDGPPRGYRGAVPLGLHVEGPFLHPQKKGAHNPAHLRTPAPDLVADWSPQTGVALVTLAPELPGALETIAALVGRGVVVSAGHSTATYAQAQAGFAAGIRYGTHLFNAMPTLHHREPGLAAALLTAPQITVGLITDDIHVHPDLVRLVWQVLGPERLNLVSDAMAALGMPPGDYLLGDFTVTVSKRDARLANGTLAGVILPVDGCLRNLIRCTGCAVEDGLATVTTTPADLLGHAHKGRIVPGADADLVLLDGDLRVVHTWVGGEKVG